MARFAKYWKAHIEGMATDRPSRVQTRASEMAPASAVGLTTVDLPMMANAFTMPSTVPSSPTIGATLPMRLR